MNLVRFGIYLAKVHFDDKPDVYKVRPVLVFDEDNLLVLTLKMTSNTEQNLYRCYVIKNCKECGLKKPTSIVIDPPYIIESSDLFENRLIGILDNFDLVGLQIQLQMEAER